MIFLPSPGGGGSTRVQRAAGWGDGLSPRTVSVLKTSPRPCAFRCAHPQPTLPLQGRVKKVATVFVHHTAGKQCPTPTIPPSAPSSRSIPHPISRSRTSLTACSRPGWPRPARRRRDRRLRARSLGTRTEQPARCRRTRSVRRVLAQSVHGARTEGLVAHAGADQRVAASRSIRNCAITTSCAGARWCRWPT